MSVESRESSSDSSIDVETPKATASPSGTKLRFVIYMAISYCSLQGCTYFFHEWAGFDETIAAGAALVLVSLMNFFWLMDFVYRTGHEHRWRQFWKYLQSIVGFRLWEMAVFYVLHDLLGVQYLIATTIMQAQGIAMKFIVYKKLIFRAKPSAEHDEELAMHAAPPDFTEK